MITRPVKAAGAKSPREIGVTSDCHLFIGPASTPASGMSTPSLARAWPGAVATALRGHELGMWVAKGIQFIAGVPVGGSESCGTT